MNSNSKHRSTSFKRVGCIALKIAEAAKTASRYLQTTERHLLTAPRLIVYVERKRSLELALDCT